MAGYPMTEESDLIFLNFGFYKKVKNKNMENKPQEGIESYSP